MNIIQIGKVGCPFQKSVKGNWYITTPKGFWENLNIYDPLSYAEYFGEISSESRIPAFPNYDDFVKYTYHLKYLARIPKLFWNKLSLEEIGDFIYYSATAPIAERDNFTTVSSILPTAFSWDDTGEGYDYWSNINKRFFNISENENRLQEQSTDRSREDRSEGNRICCKGNESGYRFSFTRRRKAVKCSKRGTRSCRINIPVRSTTRLRLD